MRSPAYPGVSKRRPPWAVRRPPVCWFIGPARDDLHLPAPTSSSTLQAGHLSSHPHPISPPGPCQPARIVLPLALAATPPPRAPPETGPPLAYLTRLNVPAPCRPVLSRVLAHPGHHPLHHLPPGKPPPPPLTSLLFLLLARPARASAGAWPVLSRHPAHPFTPPTRFFLSYPTAPAGPRRQGRRPPGPFSCPRALASSSGPAPLPDAAPPRARRSAANPPTPCSTSRGETPNPRLHHLPPGKPPNRPLPITSATARTAPACFSPLPRGKTPRPPRSTALPPGKPKNPPPPITRLNPPPPCSTSSSPPERRRTTPARVVPVARARRLIWAGPSRAPGLAHCVVSDLLLPARSPVP